MSSNTQTVSILRHPLIWLAAGVIAIGGAYALILALSAAAGPVGTLALPVIAAVAALVLYRLVMRRVARRSTLELTGKGAFFESLLGIETGLVFIGASVAVIAFLGGYHLEWAAADVLGVLIPIAAVNIGAAVVEELIFRGLAFQALEKLGGSWVALASTSLLFGLLHLGNPGATVWSAGAIGIEAGVLLGAAFLWRRSLWFAIGVHFAWNTTVGLLGIPVSGHAFPGLFTTTSAGPALLTGGEFGLEASLVPVVISVLISVPMLVLAHRRGNIVPRRRAVNPGTAPAAAAW